MMDSPPLLLTNRYNVNLAADHSFDSPDHTREPRKPLGTADAVAQALNKNEQLRSSSFVVMNGDNI